MPTPGHLPDRLPLAHKKQQLYFPLYPFAFEQFDLSDFDLVISNKSGFCHGILTGPETLHICYCLTPTRYVWRYHQYAEQENLGRLTRADVAHNAAHGDSLLSAVTGLTNGTR